MFIIQGNILKEKDPPKQQDYVQKIMQSYAETVTTIKGHINKVSDRLKNWWRGKTEASGPSASQKTDL